MKRSGEINIQSKNQFRLFIHSSPEWVNIKRSATWNSARKLISQLETYLTVTGSRRGREINFLHNCSPPCDAIGVAQPANDFSSSVNMKESHVALKSQPWLRSPTIIALSFLGKAKHEEIWSIDVMPIDQRILFINNLTIDIERAGKWKSRAQFDIRRWGEKCAIMNLKHFSSASNTQALQNWIS